MKGLRMVPDWVNESPASRAAGEQVLRRILDFLALGASGLEGLTEEQREEWREYLRPFQPLPQELYEVAPSTSAGTLALLAGVQVGAGSGMRSLLRGSGWPMPDALLVSTRKQTRPLRHGYALHWQPRDERSAIVAGIADLVRRVGETLRECAAPGCERLFLGKKRAEFCGPTHQQQEMNRRKAAARKTARAAERAKKGGK